MSISFSEDAQQEVVTSSRVLPEDSGEGSLRPRLLKDYTGQEKAKENLQVCIDAARLRGEPLDHVLLYGPPGLGKTTMAAVIANEMGVNMRITSGPAIEKAGDLAALLTNLQENDILFVDEIHRLNRAVEEILYPAMEDYAIDIIIGKGPSANSIRLDLPRFTLIGATTRAGQLTAPLRDRFGVNLRLELYSPAELQKIVERSAGILKVEIDSAGAYEIASRSRGTPRIANRLLKRVRDYAQVRADGIITKEVANAALAWCCFIGSAPMVRSNEHFKFTALTEKLKGKSLFADELAGHIFVLIFNLVVGIYGIKLVQQFAAWKMTSMPVSKGWSWLCVPIFGLTAAVFSVENIIDCIKHPDRGQVEDAVEKAMKEAEL